MTNKWRVIIAYSDIGHSESFPTFREAMQFADEFNNDPKRIEDLMVAESPISTNEMLGRLVALSEELGRINE